MKPLLFCCPKQLFAVLVPLLLLGCTTQNTKVVSEEVCEQILTSFSVVPIAEQSIAEHRAMLDMIKLEQEADFADVCTQFPKWDERFNAAYEAAYLQAGQTGNRDQVAVVVQAEDTARATECNNMLSAYEETIFNSERAFSIRQRDIKRLDEEMLEKGCSIDAVWRVSYIEARAQATAASLIMGIPEDIAN